MYTMLMYFSLPDVLYYWYAVLRVTSLFNCTKECWYVIVRLAAAINIGLYNYTDRSNIFRTIFYLTFVQFLSWPSCSWLEWRAWWTEHVISLKLVLLQWLNNWSPAKMNAQAHLLHRCVIRDPTSGCYWVG